MKRYLESQVKENKIIYPPAKDIYNFTQLTPLSQVKVVILGQGNIKTRYHDSDPYHGPGQAHGLCFSVRKGVPLPPSLINIYKELASDISGFKVPKHGDLTHWAEEGVLLLNASLTVRKGEANSHASAGWMTFTDAIISYLNRNTSHLVFLLWGGFAQKKGKVIHAVCFQDKFDVIRANISY